MVLLLALAISSVYALAPAGAEIAWRTGTLSLGCDALVNNSADSISHGYFYSAALSSPMASATSWARTNTLDPTDMNTFSVATLAWDTDVVVTDANYTPGPAGHCGYAWHPGLDGEIVTGATNCTALATNPANACEQFYVRYDESYTNTASTTARRNLACHENGHTVGLVHDWSSDPSCMNNFSSTGFFWVEQAEINISYS